MNTVSGSKPEQALWHWLRGRMTGGVFLERVENRVSALEKDVPANKRVSVWVDRAIWAGMGLLVMTVLKKSGLV